jgi:hypothetical protein
MQLALPLMRRALIAAVLTLGSGFPAVAMAGGAAAGPIAVGGGAGENNTIEARQFRIENARLPGRMSTLQTVTAWQVTAGTWNGQTLDGLSVVLIHSTVEGRSSAQLNCYVSHEASPAQRDAILAAFMASQPQLFANRPGVQMEPAVISLEVEGQSVVLHVGLIG